MIIYCFTGPDAGFPTLRCWTTTGPGGPTEGPNGSQARLPPRGNENLSAAPRNQRFLSAEVLFSLTLLSVPTLRCSTLRCSVGARDLSEAAERSRHHVKGIPGPACWTDRGIPLPNVTVLCSTGPPLPQLKLLEVPSGPGGLNNTGLINPVQGPG